MTLTSLYNHKTVRKYTSQPIPDDTLRKILLAGIRGSNTGNMQLYSIVVTSDAETKKRLSPAHFGQPMIENAPVVMTICADLNRVSKWCEARKADKAFYNFESFITATIDATIVAQNIALAAEEDGLGICYLGTTTYNPEQIAEVLQLPKAVVPITTLTIGYPAEKPDLTERLPLEAVIHYDTYKDYSSEDIDRYYAEKEANPENQKFVEQNNKETLAQVFAEVRYPRSAAEDFSRKVVNILRNQGLL